MPARAPTHGPSRPAGSGGKVAAEVTTGQFEPRGSVAVGPAIMVKPARAAPSMACMACMTSVVQQAAGEHSPGPCKPHHTGTLQNGVIRKEEGCGGLARRKAR